MENTALEQAKQNPGLILTLPFDTMIKFICCVGKVDKTLFQDLLETAGEKYGINLIAHSVIEQLELYTNKGD